MNAVRTRSPAPNPNAATRDTHAMQDVLYDILATGLDPEQSDARTEDIERFLFEHARTNKSPDEFRAFFAKHRLSMRAPKIQAAGSIALPPLPRAIEEDPASMPVELAVKAHTPSIPFEASLASLVPAVAPQRKPRAAIAMWAVLAALAASLGLAAWQGYATIIELRSELDRTAARGVEDRAALQSLRDHAVGLESSVAATGELVQRMDQKSDLLINTLVTNGKKTSRR